MGNRIDTDGRCLIGYVVFKKDYDIHHDDYVQGIREYVRVFAGCALPVYEGGVMRRSVRVLLPHSLLDGLSSTNVKSSASVSSLKKKGYILDGIYVPNQLSGMQGVSDTKFMCQIVPHYMMKQVGNPFKQYRA